MCKTIQRSLAYISVGPAALACVSFGKMSSMVTNADSEIGK